MTMRDALHAIRSAWWAVVSGGLVGAIVGIILLLTSVPTYTASTQLFISTRGSDSTTDLTQGSNFAQQRVSSYANLLEGDDFAKRVALALGLRPSRVIGEISASVVSDTVLINVTVSDTSPASATAIASSVGPTFAALSRSLETSRALEVSPVIVSVTSEPQLPTEPSSPRARPLVGVSALSGLLIGAFIVMVIRRLDRRVRTSAMVEDAISAPVAGLIPHSGYFSSAAKREELIDSPAVSESLRKLATNLRFLDVDNPLKVILFTSASAGEGKTSVVAALSAILAEGGRKVLVIDADLRRPRIHYAFGLDNGVGLTDVLVGSAEMSDVIQETGVSVDVLPAGSIPPNPGELLRTQQMRRLLTLVRSDYDFVLLDSAPLLPVADTVELAPVVDGTALVCRWRLTTSDALSRVASILNQVHVRPVAAILNGISLKRDFVDYPGHY